jgi:hypothetical protein
MARPPIRPMPIPTPITAKPAPSAAILPVMIVRLRDLN